MVPFLSYNGTVSRYRLYPTSEQEVQLLEHCGHARYIWNLALEIDGWYVKGGPRLIKPPKFAALCKMLTEARKEFDWLREGSVNVQQQALRDFEQARTNFLKGTHGHPTNRKKFRNEGFRITDTCDVQRLNRKWAQVKVPKVGWVRFRLTHRDLPEAKSYRVTFKNGQWHVCFPQIPDPIEAPGTGEIAGVDRGVVITAALSTGETLNCPQLSTKERAQLRKHERRAARAPKKSEQKTAEYAKVAKIKAKEAARRKDWVEKTSTMLARSFDVIRFEKLNIRNMTASARGTAEQPGKRVRQKAGLNRSILAQGWGGLRMRTEHKAPGRVEDVPAPYTSLRCSAYGWIEKNSRKSQAEFVCVACGFTCNADLNASNNIAAGHAGGTTLPRQASVREPQQLALAGVGIPRL